MALVRGGASQSAVAQQVGVARVVVQYWLQKAGHGSLALMDWTSRPGGGAAPPNRTPRGLEDLILRARNELRHVSDLGYYGADAIDQWLRAQGHRPPARATISRVLKRRGAVDRRYRVRRPPPPLGWYLPAVAAGQAELDSWDFIEDLKIKDGPLVQVLNVISVHGALPASWCTVAATTDHTLACLEEHWQRWGLPHYAQFDNDTRFQGAHQYPDTLGRVVRRCWALGVIPVFAPPGEHGFQNATESYNGRWQAKVWARFRHASLAALTDRQGD